MTATLAANSAQEKESPAQKRTRLKLLKELRPIFDDALANAKENLDLAVNESLYHVATKAFDAFEKAKNAMDGIGKDTGVYPSVPGTDSHAANSPLSIAMAALYGFTPSLYGERNPKCMKAFEAMKPMAYIIHERGLCIFT